MYQSDLNQEQLDAWIAALRSGQYQQGTGALMRSPEGVAEYCCLGVLCEVVGREVGEVWKPLHQGRSFIRDYSYNGNNGFYLLPEKAQSDLSEMNDSGRSFLYIADWIRDNVLPAPGNTKVRPC